MNIKHLSVVLMFGICLAFAEPTATQPSGDGSSGSPYQISSLENLYWVSQNSDRWDKYFQQKENIDLTGCSTWDGGAGWTPIGNNDTKFTGNYDGGGKKISNLTINRPNTENVGLFGEIGRGAVIQKLGLETVAVAGARGTGTLAGRVTGDATNFIQQCYVNGGTVVGDAAVGGFVGSHNSHITTPSNRNDHPTIQECWANVNVSWSGKENSAALKFGGLSGCNQKGKIYNSYAYGSVTVDNSSAVSVTNDDGNVPSRLGGLSGCILFRGYIENSYSKGSVSYVGSVANVGGFVGKGGTGGGDGNTYGCFWDTQTSGQATSSPTSGCIGKTTSEMKTASTFSNAGWNETIWDFSGSSYPELESNPHAAAKTITLTNGSTFAPSIVLGTSNNPIGRFAIQADGTGSSLTRVTIMLEETRSGVSNFKLWKSSDDSFGGDTQKGTTVAADPGTGEYVSFALNEAVGTSAEYYFLTCDVASDASGTIRPYLEDNSSLTFFDGVLSGTKSLETLSGSDVSLPVILSFFTAKATKAGVLLEWETSAEIENAGFIIRRQEAGTSTSLSDRDMEDFNHQSTITNQQLIASYQTTNALVGQGSVTKSTRYTFTDTKIEAGKLYIYTLSDVTYSGKEIVLKQIEVKIESEGAVTADSFTLLPVFPNPFNARFTVAFNLMQAALVSVEIVNLHGRKMLTIIEDALPAGAYSYQVSAADFSSGIYFLETRFNGFRKTQKIVLLK
jgi:hypothetical protein